MSQNEYSLAMLRAQQDLGENIQGSSCDYSGKDYEISDKDHERGYYKDFGKFYCIECDRSSDRNFDLNRHMKTHYQQKEYHCELCTKTFSRLDALKRHQKMGISARKIHCKLTVEQENSLEAEKIKPSKKPSSKKKTKKSARLEPSEIEPDKILSENFFQPQDVFGLV